MKYVKELFYLVAAHAPQRGLPAVAGFFVFIEHHENSVPGAHQGPPYAIP